MYSWLTLEHLGFQPGAVSKVPPVSARSCRSANPGVRLCRSVRSSRVGRRVPPTSTLDQWRWPPWRCQLKLEPVGRARPEVHWSTKVGQWDTRCWKQPLWDASRTESTDCQSMAQSRQVRCFGTRPELGRWFTRGWMSRFGTRPKLGRWSTSQLTTSGSLTTSSGARASTRKESQLNESVHRAVDLAAEREEAPAAKSRQRRPEH